MKYHPPRLDWVPEEDFDLYKDVVNTAYEFHDLMLGTLMHLAGEDTTVILCSDHGFHPDHLRPRELPNEPAGPAAEHRHYGVFAMKGPGVKRDELVYGATLLDIAPTILSLYGLPVAQDMDGKPLLTALESPATAAHLPDWPAPLPSWDAVPGDAGTHPEGTVAADAGDAQEALRQLVELGYLDELDPEQAKAVAQTVRELHYNLARDLLDCRKHGAALPLLAQLWDDFPDESRFGVHVFHALLDLERVDEAGAALERLEREKARYAEAAAKELAELREAWKDRPAEDLSEDERFRVNRLRKRASVNQATLAWLRGQLLDAQGQPEAALAALAEAEQVQTHNLPALYLKQGDILLSLRRRRAAEERFNKALALDPINPAPYLGLARCHLGAGRWQGALDAATTSLGLRYFQPQAHFYCGFALARLGRREEGIASCRIAVQQAPALAVAHRLVSRLFAQPGPGLDHARVLEHRKLARQALAQKAARQAGRAAPPPAEAAVDLMQVASLGVLAHAGPVTAPLPADAVVVVSGLPRSGTSMMMQMLAAGGLPLLADGVREADADNPRGYFELEAAKKLRQDATWLAGAGGKAVKLVAQLLPNLPRDRACRIVFMERPLGEVVASQEAMLQRLGKTGGRLSPQALAKTYVQQLHNVRAALDQPGRPVSVLGVDYAAALADPAATASRLNAFLGGGLDEAAMAAAVAPQLRRQGRA